MLKCDLQNAAGAELDTCAAIAEDVNMPQDNADFVQPTRKRSKLTESSKYGLGRNPGELMVAPVVGKVEELAVVCSARDDPLERLGEHQAGVEKVEAVNLERPQLYPALTSVAEIESEAAQNIPVEIEEFLEDVVSDLSDVHNYLLLRKPDATVVMKTGDDLEKLGGGVVDFRTDVGTVTAGNILGEVAFVQVYDLGVKLIKDSRVVAEHVLVPGSPVVSSAEVSDPFVIILLASGGMLVLKVCAAEMEVLEPAFGLDGDGDDDESGVRERY
eukprot:Plantae.Rhodophyta-Palmaria_palmata.ctg2334.p1 GENE.Plantae.Rhodophyta-Palmaria_palmata.ctg2334~~Plantae.Rhodophyta-Palmaria_palmata.ctg2334.p1  ORF type:complete len:272 (+),score=55.43 Plantae.Rhodophyta-Palmaria_palmata.ctg2334:505-1320(+)